MNSSKQETIENHTEHEINDQNILNHPKGIMKSSDKGKSSHIAFKDPDDSVSIKKSKGKHHKLGSKRKAYSFAKNVPKHLLDDPLFAWMIIEDPKRELELESQDLGGFRVNNSDEESSQSDCEENIMNKEWFDDLYTDSSLDSLTDSYYYFTDYKDYVARLNQKEYKSSKNEEEKLAIMGNMSSDRSRKSNVFNKTVFHKTSNKLNYQRIPTSMAPIFGEILVKQKVVEKAEREKYHLSNPKYLGVDELSVSTTLISAFRKDNLSMSCDRCFRIPKQKETGHQVPVNSLSSFINNIHFMETDYSDPEFVMSKLETALCWAITYTETISEERAKLLIYLAANIPDSLYRWYPRIVEAVVNRRINSTNVIQGFLNIIHDLQTMKLPIDSIYSHSQMLNEDIDNYCLLKKMNRKVFSTMYRNVKKEYWELFGIEIPKEILIILYNIATRYYRSGLFKFLPLLCKLVTRGKFDNNIQIAGAVIKLISTPDPNIEEVSKWCGIEIAELRERK